MCLSVAYEVFQECNRKALLLLIKMCFFLNSSLQNNLFNIASKSSSPSELSVLDLVMAVQLETYFHSKY